MATLEITAGRLLCGQIRDLVNRSNFNGAKLTMWESSGVFSRDFVIKGDPKDLRMIQDTLQDYINERDRY